MLRCATAAARHRAFINSNSTSVSSFRHYGCASILQQELPQKENIEDDGYGGVYEDNSNSWWNAFRQSIHGPPARGTLIIVRHGWYIL